jgi:serine/threonine protein kinase
MINPAENLVGLTLEGGWYVYEKIVTPSGGSVGNFSICYKVRRGSEEAFLKALDISRAFKMDNVTKALQTLSAAHNYEVGLLQACRNRKMDKVVSILGHGKITPEQGNPGGLPVPYIIFEHAPKTAREHILEAAQNFDNASLMRALHSVAVAISQLHGGGIAHQDIKSVNVLVFDNSGNSKLTDLGRAESIEKQSAYYDEVVAGDPAYAPPELLYNDVSSQWDVRRKATDLYQLGSLVTFFFTKDSMTSLLKTFLPSPYIWTNFSNHSPVNYQIVLPYLKTAFEETINYLEECLGNVFSEKQIIEELTNAVRYLSDPDPTRRGHPENRMLASTKYSMERFITLFDRLAHHFESKLL